jgi:hypothetical protein
MFFIEKNIPCAREAHTVALELQDEAFQDLIPFRKTIEENHSERLIGRLVDVTRDIRRVDSVGFECSRAREM